jgi:hypothetical protein
MPMANPVPNQGPLGQMSNTQAAQLALVPGRAEAGETLATNRGNMAWNGIFRGVKIARNLTYIASAVTTIGVIGSLFSKNSPTQKKVFKATAAIGIGATALAAKGLYNKAKEMQAHFNAGGRI